MKGRKVAVYAWRFGPFLFESILLIFEGNYHSLWWFIATLLFLTFRTLLDYRIVSIRKSVAVWIRGSFNMKADLLYCIFVITCDILCQKTRRCFIEILIFFFLEGLDVIILHGLMFYLKKYDKIKLFHLNFACCHLS